MAAILFSDDEIKGLCEDVREELENAVRYLDDYDTHNFDDADDEIWCINDASSRILDAIEANAQKVGEHLTDAYFDRVQDRLKNGPGQGIANE